MIAAGWDTVGWVLLSIIGLMAVTAVAFGLLWLLWERRHGGDPGKFHGSEDGSFFSDADMKRRLDDDIRQVRPVVDRYLTPGVYDQDVDEVNETNVDRWAGQILTASTAKIISEALR